MMFACAFGGAIAIALAIDETHGAVALIGIAVCAVIFMTGEGK